MFPFLVQQDVVLVILGEEEKAAPMVLSLTEWRNMRDIRTSAEPQATLLHAGLHGGGPDPVLV